MRSSSKMLEILFDEYLFHRETESAYCVKIEGKWHWLPKSQCEEPDTLKHTIMVPEWLVIKKGLEGYVFE